MDDAYPKLTDIDELFILSKASNADRLRFRNEGMLPHLIYHLLIREIFEMASNHLNKIRWSPEDTLSRGGVIGL